jgi:hypothetical protein
MRRAAGPGSATRIDGVLYGQYLGKQGNRALPLRDGLAVGVGSAMTLWLDLRFANVQDVAGRHFLWMVAVSCILPEEETPMTSTTLIGEVRQGQLHVEQPLSDFEGRRVLVTVIAPDRLSTATEPGPASHDEPPDDLNVEVDVFVPMPSNGERLTAVSVRDLGPAQPCLMPIDVPPF